MILWILRGYSDPEGEFAADEIVCSIERLEDGYRLLVEHHGEVQIHGHLAPGEKRVRIPRTATPAPNSDCS